MNLSKEQALRVLQTATEVEGRYYRERLRPWSHGEGWLDFHTVLWHARRHARPGGVDFGKLKKRMAELVKEGLVLQERGCWRLAAYENQLRIGFNVVDAEGKLLARHAVRDEQEEAAVLAEAREHFPGCEQRLRTEIPGTTPAQR